MLWEASDRICGKRLKAIVPELLKSLESHEHLKRDSNVRELLLVVSAASIDRLLRSIQSQAGGRTRRRTVGKIRSLVKVKRSEIGRTHDLGARKLILLLTAAVH